MSTTLNAPAKITPGEQQTADQLIAIVREIPQEKQLSWLQLCRAKDTVKQMLELKAVEIQKHLLKYTEFDILQLQTAIDNYKKGLKELPEIRKSFTKYLDKIADQLMEVEKLATGLTLNGDGRWVPNEQHVLPLAETRFLALRETDEANKSASQKRAQEFVNYKTHVNNEYIRISTAYEIALSKTTADSYIQALKDELTDDGLKQYVTVTEKCLREVQLLQPNKFAFTIIDKTNPDQLQEIIKATPPAPNYSLLLNKAILAMREQFMLYFTDKQNAEKATTFIAQQQKQQESNSLEHAQTSSAVNMLAGQGTAVAVLGGNGVRSIKRKFEIVIKDEDPEWAARVIAEYLARRNTCQPRLTKITKWGNLSVKQMAAALQEEDEQITGFEYREVKK